MEEIVSRYGGNARHEHVRQSRPSTVTDRNSPSIAGHDVLRADALPLGVEDHLRTRFHVSVIFRGFEAAMGCRLRAFATPQAPGGRSFGTYLRVGSRCDIACPCPLAGGRHKVD